MPAVDLAKLKIQVAELGDAAQKPDLFIKRLHDLLNFYADRTLRIGQGKLTQPHLPSYHAPVHVLRQIELELNAWINQLPGEMLTLADALWLDSVFESRLLAIDILSKAPPNPPEAILARINAWAQPSEEPRLLQELLSSRRTRLQSEHPDTWLNQVQTWLDDPNPTIQGLGLQALLSIVQDKQFENLPGIFRSLTPFMLSTPSSLLPDLLSVIEYLAERSPMETAFYLHQSLSLGTKTSASRIARRSLDFFPPDVQKKLRSALVENIKDNQTIR